jgi:putative transposase
LPRTARRLSQSGIYHIMVRGINRQVIFKDANDIDRYLQTLQKLRNTSEFAIYAYCFMRNHVHLLLREGLEPVSQTMRKLGSSYVYWYNHKYERVGYLFQDRFKSEAVEDNTYFLTVLRYIHQNPLKAGLCSNIQEYKWSSYHDYLNLDGFTDTDFALKIYNLDKKKAVEHFIAFHSRENDDCCLDMETTQPLTDREAADLIIKICKISEPEDLKETEKPTRERMLNILKTKHPLSIRQIARLTGINRNIVERA